MLGTRRNGDIRTSIDVNVVVCFNIDNHHINTQSLQVSSTTMSRSNQQSLYSGRQRHRHCCGRYEPAIS